MRWEHPCPPLKMSEELGPSCSIYWAASSRGKRIVRFRLNRKAGLFAKSTLERVQCAVCVCEKRYERYQEKERIARLPIFFQLLVGADKLIVTLCVSVGEAQAYCSAQFSLNASLVRHLPPSGPSMTMPTLSLSCATRVSGEMSTSELLAGRFPLSFLAVLELNLP